MTDNEKRAHDLAIATLPFLRDNHYAMIENGDIPEGTAFNTRSSVTWRVTRLPLNRLIRNSRTGNNFFAVN